MKLPGGHAKRLFIGFICSIGFLTLFAVLVAHNTAADSTNTIVASSFEYPLTIHIPTPHPQETIEFYKKLGFNMNTSLSGGLDVVCMEKGGTPYKLEIYHQKHAKQGQDKLASGFSFPVGNLYQVVEELESKGVCTIKPRVKKDKFGSLSASLHDPNGVSITMYQQ